MSAREEKCSWKKDLPISLAEQLKVMQIPCLRSDCYPYLPLLPGLQACKGLQHKQPYSGSKDEVEITGYPPAAQEVLAWHLPLTLQNLLSRNLS